MQTYGPSIKKSYVPSWVPYLAHLMRHLRNPGRDIILLSKIKTLAFKYKHRPDFIQGGGGGGNLRHDHVLVTVNIFSIKRKKSATR